MPKTLQRFLELTSPGALPTDCWQWRGGRWSQGRYGYFATGRAHETVSAHRWSYMWFVEDLVPGLQIDHLCGNRLCVNPLHLEQVSQEENLARFQAKAKNCCKRGHAFDRERANGQGRYCNKCVTINARLRRTRK